MERNSKVYLGVDIGGTKVAAGLVDEAGQILCKVRRPMNAHGTPEAALAEVRAAIEETLQQKGAHRVLGIGLSSPGPVDPRKGIVLTPANLPCWRNYPLAETVEEIFGLPTRLRHDSDAAALAEAVWGAAVGHKCVFYATIGTGIGTSVIYEGSICVGRTGAAGEGGHMTIDYRGEQCRCGKRGCIEMLAAGPAIAARARRKIADFPERGRALLELVDGDVCKVRCETVAAAWKNGDSLATEVLKITMDALSIWLGNIVDMLEPDVIVVGGGVAGVIAPWFDHIRGQLHHWSVNARCGEIPFVQAHYGNDAGLVGSAASCVSGALE